MNPKASDLEHLSGEVEGLVYRSEESGFTICGLVIPGRRDLVTVAGTMPGIQPGERLATGRASLRLGSGALYLQFPRTTVCEGRARKTKVSRAGGAV